ncbi:TetR/AcrR family transcriptional regulator [Sphingomonas sp. PB4P5]|uniref:TetR/AcrR family transcriptional regulator n=1 Tax=Parasphingomonas puruogangriensis TaxID=3096155 RepID=UPI002FCA34EA
MIDRKDSPNEVTNSSDPVPSSRAEIRRGRIIAAARTLFSENGFHNTGIAQIAKLSGVLVGQIYRDFANKEEIVAAIVERDLEPFLLDATLGSAVANGDVDGALGWIAHVIAGEPDHDARLVAEIIAESSRNDRIAAIFQSVQERLHDSIISALTMLAPAPAHDRRRAILADVILTVSAGVFQRRMGQVAAIDPDMVAALTDMVLREIARLREQTG